jgi:hypothetical protein
MYIYTLVTFGLKTFERLVVIEKFYFDLELAAFLFFAKFWILGTTIMIGFRGARIISSLSQLSEWWFFLREVKPIVLSTLVLIILIFFSSKNLVAINSLQLDSLAHGISRATFLATGLYCVCLSLYSLTVMIAEIRCSRLLMYIQALTVSLAMILIIYSSETILFYLTCSSILFIGACSSLAYRIIKQYD